MSMHKTIRIDKELDGAIKEIQIKQHRKSWSETAAYLLTVGIESEGIVHFNRACALLGVTWQREAFSKWRQANEVPTFAMLSEWENYLEAFERDGLEQDLRDTQSNALAVLQ